MGGMQVSLAMAAIGSNKVNSATVTKSANNGQKYLQDQWFQQQVNMQNIRNANLAASLGTTGGTNPFLFG